MAKRSYHRPDEVTAYLHALSPAEHRVLAELRRIIRDAYPAVEERVSYRIPVFRLGRDLVGISAHRAHCSLHTMSPALARTIAKTHPEIHVVGATIHFTPDMPLPIALVRELLRARIAQIA